MSLQTQSKIENEGLKLQTVIIIGAGPAGLTAAYTLLKESREYKVYILDENEQAGGIARTICYKGNRMDLGGHRFFSKEEAVMKWWQEIMPGNNTDADNVLLRRRRISRIYYRRKFFDYPLSLKWQTFSNMGFAKTLRAGISYLRACVNKLPEDSLENFYINRFGKVLYKRFFESYTQKVWGRHPREIAAAWGSQRVRGLSVRTLIKDAFLKLMPKDEESKVETSLIKAFLYPKYGPGHLWELTAEQIEAMGGEIIWNAWVTKLDSDKDEVKGLTYSDKHSQKETTIHGDIFISTMPLKDLIKGMGQKVPSGIQHIAQGLPYRDFVTIGLLVSKLKIKNLTKLKTLNSMIPDCWIYIQDEGVQLGRIQIFNNWSPYLVKDIDHTIWIGLEYFCQEGDSFWSLSEEASLEQAIQELIALGILEKKEDVLDYHRERIKKAYPAYFDTYKEIDKLRAWLNEFHNLYCIGRNGQHRYNNMDHSMMTAFEAVKHIMGEASTKEKLWDVNIEAEYHEEKN